MKYDKQAPFSVDDNLDKSVDKISADMEVADMEKYDKQAPFSVDDNLDKSEEVSSAQKKGRRTFRELVGDFFDNIDSALFGTPLRTAFSIFAIYIIAIILWCVWGYSMGWISFAEDNSDSVEASDLYYNNTKISIKLQKSGLPSDPEDNFDDSAEDIDLYYNNTKISIKLQKSDLSSCSEDN